jgi:hypothetical protein
MGHTYAELFSNEALERHNLIKRKISLFDQMESISASKLTVGELMLFIKLNIGKFEVTPDDLDELEKILDSIKNEF